MRLEGRTALITGGSGGIGFATAKLFVAEGARIAITGHDKLAIDAAAARLSAETVAIHADFVDLGSAMTAIASAAEALGGIDFVFANCHSEDMLPGGAATAPSDDDFHAYGASVLFALQASVLHLRGGGSVILDGSALGSGGIPSSAALGASKWGRKAVVLAMASELSSLVSFLTTMIPPAPGFSHGHDPSRVVVFSRP